MIKQGKLYASMVNASTCKALRLQCRARISRDAIGPHNGMTTSSLVTTALADEVQHSEKDCRTRIACMQSPCLPVGKTGFLNMP
jgi:hypothetical protein